jgi:hypothetical protein
MMDSRANTRSKKIKRDLPPTTGPATNSNTEDSPSATVAATVSFATPDRADGVTAVGGDEAILASSGAGAVAGGTTTSTRARSGRSLSTESSGESIRSNAIAEKDMATPVAAPTPKAAATVTPPDDKTKAPSSSSVAGAGPTITDQEQPPAVTPAGAGGSAIATTNATSPPTVGAKTGDVVEPHEPPLSPGAKRFGLRKRKPKSPSPVEPEDVSRGNVCGTTSSSDRDNAPRSPRPSPAAAAAAAAAAAVTSAVSGGLATTSRNVTFSPVPPQQHHYAGGSTAASGASGVAKPLPTLQEGEPSTTSTVPLPPDSPGGGKKKGGGGGKSAAAAKSSSKEKGGETAKDRGGRATPTNFATDFGKSINSPSFQTGEGGKPITALGECQNIFCTVAPSDNFLIFNVLDNC